MQKAEMAQTKQFSKFYEIKALKLIWNATICYNEYLSKYWATYLQRN